MIRVGVDVGGTFTDIILENHDANKNEVTVTKVSSTPHDQSEGVVKGVLQVCQLAGVSPSDIDMLYHGTTVATNMVIERDGAEVGMLTTRGFRDILHMARHKRPHNFSLQYEVPWQSKPLVKRRNRIPITERLMPPTGEVETPLNEDEVRAAAELLKKRGINSIVVAFLFSFLNNDHEMRAKEIVSSIHPDAYIYTSSEVVNVIREYERFSSTAMNAYIGPKTARYLSNLENRLKKEGINSQVRIMQSNGGISTIENSSDRPIGLLLSGPAGGVIGARSTGEYNNISNIITIDIGGTSADISVIQDGNLRIKNPRDTEVASLPVLVPMLDIDAIGAGGGSIAYIDDGGAFRVGPKSAGAVPGPACYGNGGEHPTVTDAQVVLGRLDQEQFLGGDIVIKPELAEKAIKTHIADALGMSVTEAALGILKIINNNMALAINSNSVAKGIDPRGFTLMGFGGAGPLHAVALAEMISAKNIISPSQPGITAALGLLVSDLKYEYTRSVLIPLNQASDNDLAQINQIVEDLKAEADQQLDQDNVPKDKRQYEYIMECRYLGQGFELRAKMPNEPLTTKNVQVVIDNFYDVHKQQYGHAFKDQITEAITVRVVASADVEKLQLNKLEKGGSKNPEYAHLYNRDTVFDDNKAVSTPRYDRGKLKSGDTISGPAIVTQHNSTTIIPPDYTATILEVGDILIEKN
ncbi:MAG: hydantoinase/oxoprolinase family protein [Proteobacteria bacterium]|nr:hydantoinase/oxoprolinase family protein [Pseudomonadota bacterium]MDA1320231.1 hydantoinase/oxoprolinase family protein [Pseudomonadota bacterium]NBR38576.1 hydantoinase/oxoprolinase family protein [Alphaproteobacteria bacterium]